MTEEQFYYFGDGENINSGVIYGDTELTLEETVGVMNELSDENEELKQNNFNEQNWEITKLIIEYDTTNKYSEKDVINKIKNILGLVMIG